MLLLRVVGKFGCFKAESRFLVHVMLLVLLVFHSRVHVSQNSLSVISCFFFSVFTISWPTSPGAQALSQHTFHSHLSHFSHIPIYICHFPHSTSALVSNPLFHVTQPVNPFSIPSLSNHARPHTSVAADCLTWPCPNLEPSAFDLNANHKFLFSFFCICMLIVLVSWSLLVAVCWL